MDGKVFPMSEYQVGLTVPPFHPNCRGCTAPYFDDFNEGGERAARDIKTGKTYNVPADMTYDEWKRQQDGGDVDKSAENGIINSGAFSGAKKTAGWENRHGELMYEEIRHRTTDVKKISEFTPFTESAVEEIKQHMFFAEHRFADGRIERFAPDFDQAQAWDRLSQGKGTAADVVLLKHEYVELTQMRLHGYVYEIAHEIANRYHNWAEILLKEMK